MQFSVLPQDDWQDRPVFVIGGGTSLRGFNFDVLQNRGHVVACNYAMRFAPCHTIVSMDNNFIKQAFHECCYRSLQGDDVWFAAYDDTSYLPAISKEEAAAAPINWVEQARGVECSMDNRHVAGKNTGHMAVNMALLRGAKKIFLLGFDMYRDAESKRHFYESIDPNSKGDFCGWARMFERLLPLVEQKQAQVFNCSPLSTITAFPKIALDEIDAYL